MIARSDRGSLVGRAVAIDGRPIEWIVYETLEERAAGAVRLLLSLPDEAVVELREYVPRMAFEALGVEPGGIGRIQPRGAPAVTPHR